MKHTIAAMIAVLLIAATVPVSHAAVELVTGYQTYIGLAADTKPTLPQPGSRYHALDTGQTWVFRLADSTWVEIDTPVTLATEDTLTVAATGAPGIAAEGYDDVVMSVRAAGTDPICSFVVEGYLAETGWGPIFGAPDSTVIAVDGGAAHVPVPSAGVFDSVRVRSEYISSEDSLFVRAVKRRYNRQLPW